MSNPKLVAIIRDEIIKQGPLSFARFMELSLYHPEYGYYQSTGNKIGPKGDYYTSPSVHPVFAKLLAKQMIQMAEILAADNEKVTLIEFGAGDGSLCQKILPFIQEQNASLFRRLRYTIIEKSQSFKAHQKERLLPQYSSTVQWEEKMPSCTGIVFSNELLDAFPVHRLRVHNGSPVEIYVGWEENRFVEKCVPLSSKPLLDYIKRVDIPTGQISGFEINLEALHWIRQVGEALTKGFVLTIDYGYPAKQLYTPARPKGTFLCYHKHTVNENPYERIGEQDMTAHIDFTALAIAGEEAGLTVAGFTDQTHFLMGLGMAQEMQLYADKMEGLAGVTTPSEARINFLAMKQLMAPNRMGKTFKVLIQGKGIASPLLDGLTFRAFPKDTLTAP